MNIRKLTTMAMLTAISMIVFLIEAQIPLPIAIPGVKLGIANVITLFAIWTLGPPGGWRHSHGADRPGQSHHRQCHGHAVQSGRRGAVLARHVPAQAPRGPEADLGDERLRRLGPQCRPAGCGCLGLRGTPALAFYAPVLLLAGIVTGFFTGQCTQAVLNHLDKLKHTAESSTSPKD